MLRIHQALLPKMLMQKTGVTIHISTKSIQFVIYEYTMAYSAAKAALNIYSKALVKEVAGKGVKVVKVSRGINKMGAMNVFLEDLVKQAIVSVEEMTGRPFERVGGVLLGRMADPEEYISQLEFQAHCK